MPKPSKLIFILSLPRSGSTLLQRILGSHASIGTTNEPWFLLPFFYMTRKQCVYSEFSWESLTNAMEDVIFSLPEGEKDYYDSIRKCTDSLYKKLNTKKAVYFLDKTPRYYFIIEDLYKLYPDAKYIFLFRHPLSIYSSVIESFNRGKLGDERHRIDVEKGPFLLAEGYTLLINNSFALRFEDLISNPEKHLHALCQYLEIDFSEQLIDLSKNAKLKGRMGDSIGTNKYSKIEKETLQKWKGTFSTIFRKRVARHYIHYLGENILEIMGYDFDKILDEIDNIDPSFGNPFADFYQQARCGSVCFFERFIFRDKLKKYIKNKKYPTKFFPHS